MPDGASGESQSLSTNTNAARTEPRDDPFVVFRRGSRHYFGDPNDRPDHGWRRDRFATSARIAGESMASLCDYHVDYWAAVKSPGRACVPHEATQKPEVEGEKRKENKSPPVALHTQEHGHEEDPRREKGTHDDHRFVVLTRPVAEPADTLVVCGRFGERSYAQRLAARTARIGRGRLRVRIRGTLSQQISQPNERFC